MYFYSMMVMAYGSRCSSYYRTTLSYHGGRHCTMRDGCLVIHDLHSVASSACSCWTARCNAGGGITRVFTGCVEYATATHVCRVISVRVMQPSRPIGQWTPVVLSLARERRTSMLVVMRVSGMTWVLPCCCCCCSIQDVGGDDLTPVS